MYLQCQLHERTPDKTKYCNWLYKGDMTKKFYPVTCHVDLSYHFTTNIDKHPSNSRLSSATEMRKH